MSWLSIHNYTKMGYILQSPDNHSLSRMHISIGWFDTESGNIGIGI
jgi:hypothetical protein